MRKNLLAAFCCILCGMSSKAQTKVFKEVSNDIASQFQVILQDEALVGYLNFVRLEKASKDSFNYQINIMDENLTDLGKVNFRDVTLDLQAVSFESDILNLSYLKTDGEKSQRAKSGSGNSDYIFTQLIDLQGKIVFSGGRRVKLTPNRFDYTGPVSSVLNAHLKQGLQLRNIPGKGFALFYGDESKTQLAVMDLTGKELWQKDVAEAKDYYLQATDQYLYVLSKHAGGLRDGGFKVTAFGMADGKTYDRYDLKDRKGNELKVIDIEKDKATGLPVLSGMILDPLRGDQNMSVKQLYKGPYEGVFTLMLKGPQKTDYKPVLSYWNDGSQMPAIAANGKFEEAELVPRYISSVRDFNGATYFIGSGYTRKVRVGSIVAGIVLSPLIIPPIMLIGTGTHKSAQRDAFLLRQDSMGKLRVESTIALDHSMYKVSHGDFVFYPKRSFYTVANPASKASFLIVDEEDDIVIYHIEKKQVVRKVPHKDKSVFTDVFPAKEGHIMVRQYNRKEKETRLSIEAL
jgi:hypothetical protein